MKKILLIIIILLSFKLYSNNLNKIITILKHVETNYDISKIGDNGKSFGILQIQKAVIIDINNYYKTNYHINDAFNEECSEEIFKLYIRMYIKKIKERDNIDLTSEDIARIWNGGPNGYKKASTLPYLKKYKKYKYLLYMNPKKCIVNGKLGVIIKSYTHTYDIFLFKDKRNMWGVKKDGVILLPKPPVIKTNQLKLRLWDEDI